jgi:hypothetical protein
MLQRNDKDDCDWPTERYVSPEILQERKRIITRMIRLMIMLTRSAPHPIMVMAQEAITDALGLCPHHATREEVADALRKLDFPVPELDELARHDSLGHN